ncbi:hypothetical protein TanjilG_07211 [Lupinus angustifolius]|uniref:Uncharacterized protein n=1 Tax=Lupinus angustifolius TaxID=3871 RepID=A0A1J7GZ88_LUPAN|nr:PREDICTED: uncharacterized protein LOC109353645 isoform X1 [Lupinus angustifolius]OIW05935.1 hypothetical protein TanjilG_07211 [Lupinus angustifolius]
MDHNSSGGKALSSANKSLVSNCPEESGWTSYFEDLSKGIEPSYCSSLGGSSLVSDAASCAAWKFSHQNHGNGSSAPNLLKKLNFKKARAKQISEDDPLEDTASSPVNSPKVKGFASSENYSELQTDDENDQVNLNGEKNDCTDLKKRGLCLVPMSMLVNYFG